MDILVDFHKLRDREWLIFINYLGEGRIWAVVMWYVDTVTRPAPGTKCKKTKNLPVRNIQPYVIIGETWLWRIKEKLE